MKSIHRVFILLLFLFISIYYPARGEDFSEKVDTLKKEVYSEKKFDRPAERVSYLITFINSYSSEEDPKVISELLSLSILAYHFTWDIEDARERAEMQKKIALMIAKWDLDLAIVYGDKIVGPQNRAETLLDLGVSPYTELPEKKSEQAFYYYGLSIQEKEPLKAALLYHKAMKCVIEEGIKNYEPFSYLAQKILEDERNFLPYLIEEDKEVAKEFIRDFKEVEDLSVPGGTIYTGQLLDGNFIEYIKKLALIDYEEALLEAESHTFISCFPEFKTCFKLISYFELAKIIVSRDKGLAMELAYKALESRITINDDDTSSFFIMAPTHLPATYEIEEFIEKTSLWE